jgi:hypothetical protein
VIGVHEITTRSSGRLRHSVISSSTVSAMAEIVSLLTWASHTSAKCADLLGQPAGAQRHHDLVQPGSGHRCRLPTLWAKRPSRSRGTSSTDPMSVSTVLVQVPLQPCLSQCSGILEPFRMYKALQGRDT